MRSAARVFFAAGAISSGLGITQSGALGLQLSDGGVGGGRIDAPQGFKQWRNPAYGARLDAQVDQLRDGAGVGQLFGPHKLQISLLRQPC